MNLFFLSRLTNTEILQNQQNSFSSHSWRAMGHHLGYTQIFSCCKEVFYSSSWEKFCKKLPVGGIIFESKIFLHMKEFFNSFVWSSEIKATKKVLISIIKLHSNVRSHSFARDIVQKNKSKLKKQSVRRFAMRYRSAVKEIKMSNNNKILHKYAAINFFKYIL